MARLARWLGPWAGPRARPDVLRECVTVGDGLRVWLYRPRRGAVRGSYLLLQGLHYAGPEDPRMDRFARVLACSGFQVYAPCVPDYRALRVSPQAHDDVAEVARWVLRHPDRGGDRLAVFTISFGSLLGLGLAAHETLGDAIARLVVFGGYRDPAAAIRFCVSGEVDGRRLGAHDPLNLPVLFMHLHDALPGRPDDTTALLAAWRRFIVQTWGRAELKVDDRHHPIAHDIAASLPEAQRELFLVGCGVEPGARELVDQALGRADLEVLDPAPLLSRVRCPVDLLHGADDDVIPFTELESLADALRPHTTVRTWLTGLYGHTGTDASVLGSVPAAARELATMVGMLGAIATPAR